MPESVAKKAVPACNIIFISGNDMKERLSGYLTVLIEQNPKAIDGSLPDLRALIADYDILILDEPFKSLDIETKTIVMSDVKQRSEGKTVIILTHDPSKATTLNAVKTIAL